MITIEQNSKINKKEIFFRIILIIFILLIIILSVLFIFFKKDKEKTLNLNKDEFVLSDKLWQEHKNKNLTTDELISNYYDELSEETLNYYLNKINLEDVTFELNVENDDSEKQYPLHFTFVLKTDDEISGYTNLTNKKKSLNNVRLAILRDTCGECC